MVDIPTQPEMDPEKAYERLTEWYQKSAQLKTLKTHEHLERVALSGFYFRQPVEGTNRISLGGGYDLKLQFGYNYKVSEEDLDQVKAADIKRLKLPWDELITYKPNLSMSTYKGLNAEQKKFVDQFLEVKESSPQLDIVPAADRAGQAAHQQAAEAAAAPAPDMNAGFTMQVVLDAEKAEPGQYFNDGETWWQLGEDIEWEEVTDPDELALLDTMLGDVQAAAEAAPKPAVKKRGRPKKEKA